MNSPPLRQNDITIAQIIQLLRQLKEGDLVRVLRFVEGIVSDRVGKKRQRKARFQTDEIENWQIGK